MRVFLAALLTMTGWSAWAEPAATYQLDNGMDVVVIEDHRAPAVVHMVWYRAGAAYEPPGLSGIAHFLEHLMFKGTETVASGEFSDLVEANPEGDAREMRESLLRQVGLDEITVAH